MSASSSVVQATDHSCEVSRWRRTERREISRAKSLAIFRKTRTIWLREISRRSVALHPTTSHDDRSALHHARRRRHRADYRQVNASGLRPEFIFTSSRSSAKKPASTESSPGAQPDDHRWLLSRIPMRVQSRRVNIYYIKQFGANGRLSRQGNSRKRHAALRPVEGGIDEPLPRVTSHELGHALGLPHRQDRVNLMASGTTGTSLNDEEIERTRGGAAKMKWFARASDLLAQATRFCAMENLRKRAPIYLRLAAIPLEGEPLTRIRATIAKLARFVFQTDARAASRPVAVADKGTRTSIRSSIENQDSSPAFPARTERAVQS